VSPGARFLPRGMLSGLSGPMCGTCGGTAGFPELLGERPQRASSRWGRAAAGPDLFGCCSLNAGRWCEIWTLGGRVCG
jgi:hypothetical protein